MTAAQFLLTTHGFDLFERPEVIAAWRGSEVVGWAFPAVVAEPDGPWFGRLRGQNAMPFDTRHSALAFVVGGCPDCVCQPVLCEHDDSGRHCEDANCGFCLNGCSAGECPMTQGDNS